MQDTEMLMSEELAQMRRQYASLKEELETQKIISRDILERTFRKNVGILDADRRIGIWGGVLFIPFVFAVCYIQGLDMWLAMLAAAGCLAQVVGYLIMYRSFGTAGDFHENILDTTLRVRKFRKEYILMNTVLWIFAAGIFIVMGVDIYNSWSTPAKGMAAVGILCMIVIAAVCAEYLYGRRVLKACDEIIQKLEAGPEN